MGTLTKLLGDQAQTRVLESLLREWPNELGTQEIAEQAGIHRSTVYNSLPPLLDTNVVKKEKQEGNEKFYVVNIENPMAKLLLQMHREMSEIQQDDSRNDDPGPEAEPAA